MSAIDNVKLLDNKIEKTVEIIRQLTEENRHLKEKAAALQEKVNELEFSILSFKEDQQHIESGIQSAMDRLNQLDANLGQNAAPPEQAPLPAYGTREMFQQGGAYPSGYHPDSPV